MATTIKFRRDTAANWTSTNPILASGEPGLETDTFKIKYGNGTDRWKTLSYAYGGLGAFPTFNGGTLTNALVITNATSSTSQSTGALTVSGGVGVGGNLYAGGILSSSKHYIQYNSNYLAPDADTNGLLIHNVGSTLVGLTLQGTGAQIVKLAQSGGSVYITSNTGTSFDPTSGSMMIINKNSTIVLATTSATNATSGALQVAGGAGFLGDVWVQGNMYLGNGQMVLTTVTSFPTATTSSIGGVRIGTGISINNRGIISVVPASTSTVGGVRIGLGLSVDLTNAINVDAAMVQYAPGTPSDWSGTAPTTIVEALDRLAALVKTLNSGTGA